MRGFAVAVLLCALGAGALGAPGPTPPARNDGGSWPTLHGDLMRTGFYPRFPKPPLKLAWRKELHRELLGTRVEVIAGEGLAFAGTYAGKMYAWEIETGAEKWVYTAGGPIGHSPMLAGGVLYFGAMDRKLYALNAADGKPRWSFEAGEGIWTSPVVFDGLVLFGARDGVFYALDAATGKERWRFRTGDRILQSASISEDGRHVLFVSEEMHAYCLRVRDGGLAWRSRKLDGITARDYFPFIFRGIAFVTTSPVKEFHGVLGEDEQMLLQRTGFTGQDKRYIPGTPADAAREQDAILAYLKERPHHQSLYALNVSDGREPWTAPIFYLGGLHNPPTPPCANPETGDVWVLTRSAYGVWDGGGEVRPYNAVGKLDTATGRVALVEHGHKPADGSRPAGRKEMPWDSFNLIGDETQALSCSPELLLSNHQGTLGSMDLQTGKLRGLWGKRDTYGGYYGPGTFGWESQGGEAKARAAGQPYGLVNEWHGPARGIASVVGNRVFYAVGSQVICLQGE